MPTPIVIDNDQDFGYKAKVLKALIGADTVANVGAGAAGALAYDSASNYFHGQRSTGTLGVKRLPWEDGTPSSTFLLNQGSATANLRNGLLSTANTVTAVTSDGSTRADFAAANATFFGDVTVPGDILGAGSVRGLSHQFMNPAETFQVSYVAPALTASYTRTMPLALPASGTRMLTINSSGQEAFAAIPSAIGGPYATDAARVTAGYVGYWQNTAGQLFYSAAATAGAVQYYNDSNGEIIQKSAPASPTAGDTWRVGEQLFYRGASTTYTLATLADVAGMMKFRGIYNVPGNASTARPDQNSVTNIKAGDMWVIGTGGVITGISGDDTLASGDFLIALVDTPTTAAGYGGIEMNQQINLTTYLAFENQTVNLTGTAASTATYTSLTNIRGCEAYDATGTKRNTLYLRIATANTVTVDGLNALTGVRVLAYGTI